tara:strand:+ start:1789 stop:2349 length:561 start_codon:yes stop_codon:yes gene_type:complete
MSEETGQKPTNPTNPKNGEYIFEDGEWWYINAHDKNRRRAIAAQNIQNTRMWVDGNYISKSHPLHKPGRYKGFTDAAFSSLDNYERSTEGEVYIIYNPAFPGWVKVGMAVDSQDRLKQYQTSSPHRDYEIVKSYKVSNRRESEAKAHKALTIEGRGRKGEWFYMGSNVAVTELDKLFDIGGQFELF